MNLIIRFLCQSTLCLILLLLLAFNPLIAQNSDKKLTRNKMWAKIGFGYTSANNFGGITGLLGAHYSSSYGILDIRYLVSDRAVVDPSYSANINETKIKEINEVSIGWGYSKDLSILKISGSAGIGSFWGYEQVTVRKERFSVVSFPLEAQLSVSESCYQPVLTVKVECRVV